MAEGKHYRSVISSRKAVTETIFHETVERHGAAAMGVVSLAMMNVVCDDDKWPAIRLEPTHSV